LTDEQLRFLREQNIPLSAMFNAGGLKNADYQSAMKAEGKTFAYGVTPCARGGHSLRTRKGHCIQCDHSKIAFMLRHDARAYIYIAASAAGRLIKIGSSINIEDRTDKLNRYQYGGQIDWQILATASSPTAGRAEAQAHARLAIYNVPGDYVRMGKKQQCYELFRCDFQDARDAVAAALGKGGALKVPGEARALAAFRFRERTDER
jgi:hypothetical protein